jgi:signal peptidase I
VEQAHLLRAIFFLDQSPFDRVEPVHGTQATALALESAEELSREVLFVMTDADAARTLCGEALASARSLASAIPAYSLKISLEGRFWEEIERVLPIGDSAGSGGDCRDRDPVSVESLTADDSLRVVCTGTSMNPTLDEPDLLEVKPYGKALVRPGDVVCFKSPESNTASPLAEPGKTIVHRVVSVGRPETGDGRPKESIRTRGDNNPTDDPWALQTGDIAGRVTTAQRGARRRAIHGGWRGLVVLRGVRMGRAIRRYAGLLPHTLYDFIAGLGPFDRLLPRNHRPRPVLFSSRYRMFVKLLMGRQTVGHYDYRLKQWQIRRPFRLFVDEQALPGTESQILYPKSQ